MSRRFGAYAVKSEKIWVKGLKLKYGQLNNVTSLLGPDEAKSLIDFLPNYELKIKKKIEYSV